MKYMISLFTSMLILCSHINANENIEGKNAGSNTGSNEETFLKTAWSDFTSPVTTPAVWILGAGTLTTAMMYITKKDISYRQRVSFKDAQPLGGFGFIGDYIGYGLLNISYIGYQYFVYKNENDLEAYKKFDHMFRASTYTFLTTQALKMSIKEKRPGYPDDRSSFPSGHSSASFAFASVVAAQHGWVWGGIAHSLAGFIATSRINDDFHYLHDVAFGITIGASYAWGIYYNIEKGSNSWMSLIPVGNKGLGFVAGSDF